MCSERWRETYAKYLLHGVSRVEVEPALHAHNAHSFEVAKHQAVAMALDVGCWESGNAGIRNNNAVLDEVGDRSKTRATNDGDLWCVRVAFSQTRHDCVDCRQVGVGLHLYVACHN